MTIVCNICGSTDFRPYGVKPRNNALCANCKSLERHRGLHYVLKANGFLENRLGLNRCLQLAPEKVTHDYLSKAYGAGYITADLDPQLYKHAQCIKLRLPEGFEIFPDEYFDLIIHNHVFEHIPGDFRTHVDQFHRLLSKNGAMVFTIPDLWITQGVKYSIQGGEDLETDEDRLREHGQEDHYKTFGYDLVDYLQTKFPKFELLFLKDSDLKKKLKSDHSAGGIIFFCMK